MVRSIRAGLVERLPAAHNSHILGFKDFVLILTLPLQSRRAPNIRSPCSAQFVSDIKHIMDHPAFKQVSYTDPATFCFPLCRTMKISTPPTARLIRSDSMSFASRHHTE
jgi:hypothetical protein